MQRIFDAWHQQIEYQKILNAIKRKQISVLSGLPQPAKASLTAALFADMAQPFLIVTAEESEAIALADDLRSFLGEKVLHFPVLELLPFEVYAHNIELVSARVDAYPA